MRLYHFTGRHHLDGIRRDGLNHGAMLLPDGTFHPGTVIWLTRSSEWAQPWATRHIVHCDRSEVRLTARIENGMKTRLFRWNDYSRRFPKDWVEGFNEAGGGSEVARNWYVYFGSIPYVNLIDLEFRPLAVPLPEVKK